MADNVPLTDLCSICHNAEWKYRCPRCSAVTCSLACVTKHKARASCTGKRDPAAYVKKDALMTASGVDRDYNFLTGVERAFDKAEHDTVARGILVNDERNERKPRPRTGRKLQHALVESRVDIRRAPVGMSRQRENHTDLHGGTGALNWTVEWFTPEDMRIVRNCAENLTVRDAYMHAQDRLHPDRRAKKRKRDAQKEPIAKAEHGTDSDRVGTSDTPSAVEEQVTAGAEDDNALTLDSITDNARAEDTNDKTTGLEDHGSHKQALIGSTAIKQPLELPTSSTPLLQSASSKAQKVPHEPQLHYYLHRPLCTGDSRVLLPVSPDTKLADVLAHRTVIEFPTFYMLRQSPERLPEGFVTETQWQAEMSGIRVVSESAGNAADAFDDEAPEELGVGRTENDTAHSLSDSNGILKSLQAVAGADAYR